MEFITAASAVRACQDDRVRRACPSSCSKTRRMSAIAYPFEPKRRAPRYESNDCALLNKTSVSTVTLILSVAPVGNGKRARTKSLTEYILRKSDRVNAVAGCNRGRSGNRRHPHAADDRIPHRKDRRDCAIPSPTAVLQRMSRRPELGPKIYCGRFGPARIFKHVGSRLHRESCAGEDNAHRVKRNESCDLQLDRQ